MIPILHGPASRAGFPYSTFTRAGGFVYLSGLLGDDASGQFPPGGVAAETRLILHKADAILAEAGCGFANLVKVTVSLREEDDFDAFNQVYAEFIPRPHPARTTNCVPVVAAARIGIDFIAYSGLHLS